MRKLLNLFIKDRVKRFWKHRKGYLKSKNPISKAYHYIRYTRNMLACGASIPLVTKIEGEITFPHGLNGVFISQGAAIGKGCTIFQQVTVGANTAAGSKRRGAPTIGDNCLIGAGAKIIGKVTIGDNVRIGANCVVVEDIPANSTVVLEKPRVIVKQDPQDNKFIPFGEL